MLQEGGFRVDIGPTILVMKQTFEDTYRAIGQDINQRIKFVSLDPNYRPGRQILQDRQAA